MKDPRGRHYKGMVVTLGEGKFTLAGLERASERFVELRMHDRRGRSQEARLSLPQAREAMRHLTSAIQALEALARHDGSPCSSAPREGVGEISDVGQTENSIRA